MIDTETVLILGAGASEPYGFPIGSGLKESILNGLTNDKEQDLYRTYGFSNDNIAEFRKVLTTSPFATIDAILSYRPSLAKIGKFAIVKTLSVCQKPEKVFPPRDWYHELFSRLGLENPDIPPPPLSVLTFNYDNSFEYFFDRIIETQFEGENKKSVRNKFDAINIIHLHGCLGPYPDEGEDPFNNLSRSLGKSAIKVISDTELDESEEFVRAFELLKQANKIIFLGFGYADINLRRLRISEIADNPAIYGTCYQSTPDSIKKAIGKDIKFCEPAYQCKQALFEWKGVI
jgi:hypothetical protein